MIDKIYYLITDENEKTLVSKLDEQRKIIDEIKGNDVIVYSGVKFRVGIFKWAMGTVIAYTSSKDFIKSSQKFNTYLSVLGNSIDELKTNKDSVDTVLMKQITILLHNLVSLNAHNLQEIYSLVPEEKFANSIGNKKSFISNLVKSNPEKTASTVLKLLKNNIAMKTEFSVFVKLFEENPKLNMKNHNIHKVLMNLLYGFFPDFTDQHIIVTVRPSTIKAYFDYESLYVAFFYLLENATKYIQRNSTFDICFVDLGDEAQILFDMTSLKIQDDERERIFNEGYSGEMALKKEKQGKGIGMFRVKRILELNNAKIEVEFKNDYRSGSSDYQNNIFKITLKKESFFLSHI